MRTIINDDNIMLSWYSHSEVNRKNKGKVNILPRTTDTGTAINFAKCARVLRKLDLCPGEKATSNMSSMPNSSTAARTYSTREPSWAEDFIDLSEFCQPSTIPTRMEDSVDERVNSPIGSAVRNHGFDYGLDGNEGLDPSLEETLWYLPSPNTIQEELCDPISDWLASTKETINSSSNSSSCNDNNLLPSSRTEISYNLADILNPRLTPVPNAPPPPLYDRKPMAFCSDDSLTPPLQPDTTFFHSNSDAATATDHADHRRPHHPQLHRLHQPQRCSSTAAILNDNFLAECVDGRSIKRLPPADSLFKEKQSSSSSSPPPQPPPPPLLPSISTLTSTTCSASISACVPTSAVANSSTTTTTASTQPPQPQPLPQCDSSGAFQQPRHSSSHSNQFLEGETRVTGSGGLGRLAVNVGGGGGAAANVTFPCSVQSPSITQSSASFSMHSGGQTDEPTTHHRLTTAPSPIRRRHRLKPDETDGRQSAAEAATPADTPDMINPLVSKNTDFDLVSYVFEDSKASISFDISNVPSRARNDEPASGCGASAKAAAAHAVTIKTEPKEESLASAATAAEEAGGGGGGGLMADLFSRHRRLKRKSLALHDDDEEAAGSCSSASSSITSASKLKRSRRYSNCSSEDLTQLESEKYRELRNKNNEASRRSRANRKSREVEMRDHASKLDAENRRLKFKAEEMEKLVKRLRNCLMQLVLKRSC